MTSFSLVPPRLPLRPSEFEFTNRFNAVKVASNLFLSAPTLDYFMNLQLRIQEFATQLEILPHGRARMTIAALTDFSPLKRRLSSWVGSDRSKITTQELFAIRNQMRFIEKQTFSCIPESHLSQSDSAALHNACASNSLEQVRSMLRCIDLNTSEIAAAVLHACKAINKPLIRVFVQAGITLPSLYPHVVLYEFESSPQLPLLHLFSLYLLLEAGMCAGGKAFQQEFFSEHSDFAFLLFLYGYDTADLVEKHLGTLFPQGLSMLRREFYENFTQNRLTEDAGLYPNIGSVVKEYQGDRLQDLLEEDFEIVIAHRDYCIRSLLKMDSLRLQKADDPTEQLLLILIYLSRENKRNRNQNNLNRLAEQTNLL